MVKRSVRRSINRRKQGSTRRRNTRGRNTRRRNARGRNTRGRNTRGRRRATRRSTRRSKIKRKKRKKIKNKGRTIPADMVDYIPADWEGVMVSPGEKIVRLNEGVHYHIDADTVTKQTQNMTTFLDTNIVILQKITTPCGGPRQKVVSESETEFTESRSGLNAIVCFNQGDEDSISEYYGNHGYVFIKCGIPSPPKHVPPRFFTGIPGPDKLRSMSRADSELPFLERITEFFKIFKSKGSIVSKQRRDGPTSTVTIRTQSGAKNQSVHTDDDQDENSIVFFYIFDYENRNYRQPFNIYNLRLHDEGFEGHE